MAPPIKKPRVPSAYMVFTDERRQEVQVRLKQESESGKVAAPAIAKALGEVWKGMSEEEKDVYRQKSKERAEAAAAAAAQDAAAAAGDQEQQDCDTAEAAGEDATSQAAAPAIPKHIVKRIMLADDEVQRVSADALWLLGEAARLFLHQLAQKGAAAAATKKRKTIKLEDFEHVVRCDKRLVAVGLKDVVNNRRLYEAHGIAAALGGSGAAGRKPRGTPAAAAAAAGKNGAGAADKQQQDGAEPGTAADGDAADAAVYGDDQEQQLTDEERIALEEVMRTKAAAAAKARAVKAAERKVAKEVEVAKDTHKITTFFVSNKPDKFV